MPLVTINDILIDAHKNRYAVPAFDVMDLVSAEAVIAAAQEIGYPVIILLPEVALLRFNLDELILYLKSAARRANIPVAIQLDHGTSIEMVQRCIHAGFTSIMIDGSSLTYQENVRLTKKAVELAHLSGVIVEGEIGHVGGGGFSENEVDENQYTEPGDAIRFVEETGVDALAIAVGTVHGIYKGVPKLDFERIDNIRRDVSIPLVLHGGSGLSDNDYRLAIQKGINKINIFTEISTGAAHQSLQYASENMEKLYFASLIHAGASATKKIASKYLSLFRI